MAKVNSRMDSIESALHDAQIAAYPRPASLSEPAGSPSVVEKDDIRLATLLLESVEDVGEGPGLEERSKLRAGSGVVSEPQHIKCRNPIGVMDDSSNDSKLLELGRCFRRLLEKRYPLTWERLLAQK